MKKIIVILGLIATIAMVCPLDAFAAAFVDNDRDGVYENDATVSMGRYGTIQVGDFTWEYTDEEAGEKTWTITLNVTSSTDFVYFTLVPSFLTIGSVSVTSNSDYLLANQSRDGNNVNVFLEGTGSGTTLEITVITTDTAEEGCLLNVSPINTLDCSTSIPGYYFDNNGNQITEEEYNQVCGNSTPENPDDIPNSPDTGSVVPYIAIGGGLVAIVVVYLFSRKSNKVYKI